jgi:hypothetical protein
MIKPWAPHIGIGWLWWCETDVSKLPPLLAYCLSPGDCDVDHGIMDRLGLTRNLSTRERSDSHQLWRSCQQRHLWRAPRSYERFSRARLNMLALTIATAAWNLAMKSTIVLEGTACTCSFKCPDRKKSIGVRFGDRGSHWNRLSPSSPPFRIYTVQTLPDIFLILVALVV